MRAVVFDQAFMFAYSARPGTYAARCLADDVLQPRLTIRDGALDLKEADRAEVCIEKLQALP